jgi:hypothetical protein
MSNLVDLPVEGFLFETGSGIHTFMGYLDGGEGVEVDPEQTWMTMFMGLSQGEHTILFEAVDVAHNRANATITVIIDAVAPELDIVSPKDQDSTRDPNQLVQGTYEDDVSELQQIEVRINGVTISGTTGVINEYVTLTEGVNTIVIDATDLAGNTVEVWRTVTLDSYPPTLYVYSPLNLLVTSDDILEMNGLSEADTPIKIEQVDAATGNLISSDTVTARADGTFRHTLELQEGDQHIVFTAQDPAGNVRDITRTVTLDTTPPGLVINSPEEGAHISDSVVPLVAQVEDPNPEDVRVFVNGIPVSHVGFVNVAVPLVEGLNTIVVMAMDAVDNTATRTVNVTRDTIAPTLVVETPEFVLTNERKLVIRGAVDDASATVTVSGTPVNLDEDLKFVYEVPDLSQADNPIVVAAEDMAGNTASHVIDFIFDNEAPEIELLDQPGAETSELVIMLNGTVMDNEAVIDFVIVRGEAFPVVEGKFNVLMTVDTSGDGWNNFTISATDDAGNVGVKNINVQYIRPPDKTVDTGTEDNLWWYYGILLIIAALVIILTVFVFAKRGEEE